MSYMDSCDVFGMQVMAVLLEENAAPSGQSPFHSNQSQIPFCTSHTQIRPPPYLQGQQPLMTCSIIISGRECQKLVLPGCTLTFLEYSPTHPHLLMTTHTADTNQVCCRQMLRLGFTHSHVPIQVCPDLVPMYGGMVCVWDTREPSQPQ